MLKDQPPPDHAKVLVATDLSPASDSALREGWVRVAVAPDRTTLHIVHVAKEPAPGRRIARRISEREGVLDALHEEVSRRVSLVAQRNELAPLDSPVVVHIRFGHADREILQVAADLNADLLVVGSHDKSGVRHLLGSVSRKLLASARLPLLIARPKALSAMRVEVALDPPCPDCVAARHESDGRVYWCELHGREHIAVHALGSTHHVHFAKASADSMGAYVPR